MKKNQKKCACETYREGNQNLGFSLIELIVTIAIISILSAGAIYGISSITGFRAKEAGELLYQTVSETKVDAMSKGEGVYMKVYSDGKNYWVERENGEKKKLGSTKRIKITYSYGSTTEKVESVALILSFQKATGAFKPILKQQADGSLSQTSNYCDGITVQTSSGNRTKLLKFYPDTGKCDYEEK